MFIVDDDRSVRSSFESFVVEVCEKCKQVRRHAVQDLSHIGNWVTSKDKSPVEGFEDFGADD